MVVKNTSRNLFKNFFKKHWKVVVITLILIALSFFGVMFLVSCNDDENEIPLVERNYRFWQSGNHLRWETLPSYTMWGYSVYLRNSLNTEDEFVRIGRMGEVTNEGFWLSSLNPTVGNNTLRVISPIRWSEDGQVRHVGHINFNYVIEDSDVYHTFRTYGETLRWSLYFFGNPSYNVYLDIHDGRGLQRDGRSAGSSGSRELRSLELAQGKNTIFVATETSIDFTSSFQQRTATITRNRNVSSWDFQFSSKSRVTYYDFHLENDVLVWNGFVGERYSLEFNDHDGRGFVDRYSRIGNRVELRHFDLTSGMNTVRVRATQTTSDKNSITQITSTGYWNVEFEEKTDLVKRNIAIGAGSFEWGEGATTYRVYVGQGVNPHFQIVGTNSPLIPRRNFSALRLEGDEIDVVVRIVGYDFLYENGNLLVQRKVSYWNFEYQEVNTESLEVAIDESRLVWSGTPSLKNYNFYNFYVNRHDGRGYLFLFSRNPQNVNVFLSALTLTEGKNTIRVEHSHNSWLYHDGFLIFGRIFGSKSFEFSEENFLVEYYFEIVQGNRFAWNSNVSWYDVYVNRHDGNGFVPEITSSFGVESLLISRLNLKEGTATIRVSSRIRRWEYQDGTLFFAGSFGYWELTVEKMFAEGNYSFSFVDYGRFIWENMIEGMGYRNYIQRPESNELESTRGWWFGNSGSPHSFSDLMMTAGANIIWVKSIEYHIFTLYNGTLSFKRTRSYFEINFCDEDFDAGHTFEVNDNFLTWNLDGGTSFLQYRVYIKNTETNGVFENISTWASTMIILSEVPFASGENVLKIISSNRTWSMQNGILRLGRRYSLWKTTQ
ncbi:MAG: hypothetical protein FWC11_03335 [Firmicutes bacterium]|nr:hypothetical protein [Bacillota bacterium]